MNKATLFGVCCASNIIFIDNLWIENSIIHLTILILECIWINRDKIIVSVPKYLKTKTSSPIIT